MDIAGILAYLSVRRRMAKKTGTWSARLVRQAELRSGRRVRRAP